jgi:hypothetical protein
MILILWAHRVNIKRLFNGTESTSNIREKMRERKAKKALEAAAAGAADGGESEIAADGAVSPERDAAGADNNPEVGKAEADKAEKTVESETDNENL